MVGNIELTAEQKEKKKQMLLDMKAELEDLQYKSNHSKTVNLELFVLRLSKVFLRAVKKASPCIAKTIVTFMIFKYLHHTPFIIDDVEQKLTIQKEFDSNNNIRYEMQYDYFNNTDKKLQVFGKWQKVDDEYYEREVLVYLANDISVEQIKQIVEENKTSLSKLLGEPSIITERKNHLTSEEINSPICVQATIYYDSLDSSITVKEDTFDNINSTIVWFFINIVLDSIILSKLSKKEQETIVQYARRLKEENPRINPDELEKLIKIKQDNYDRMVR